MKIEKVYINNYIDKISNVIKNKEEIIIYGVPPKTIVVKGKAEIYEDYCKDNNIEVYNSYNEGGCIVSAQGDIIVAMTRFEGWGDGKKFGEWMKSYLIDKGLNASLSDNDILIDNKYKVASYSSVDLGDRYIYTGMMITINANLDLINHICKKPINKEPRGLKYYNITTEEMEKDFVEFLKNY